MSVAIPIPLLQNLPDVNVTPGVGVDEYALTYDHDTAKFVLRAPVAAPDLSGYALLAGRAGGQTLYGGTAANDDITIHGTSDATRTTSYVLLQPTAGNVGIGTSTPVTLLHVNGSGSFGDAVTVGDADRALNLIGTAAVMKVKRNSDSGAATLELLSYRANGTTQTGYWDMFVGPNDYLPGKFSIRDRATGRTGELNRIVIDTTGYVGIGTTAPATALHVVGAATITGGIRPAADSTTALQLQTAAGASVLNVDTTNARVGIGATDPTEKLQIAGAIRSTGGLSGGSYGYSTLMDYSGGVSRIMAGGTDASTAGTLRLITMSSTAGVFNNAVTINNVGNVGILDTAPAEALDVTGNINVTGVYKVDDVQVLSNRVIDARCADVANSGDATTDGLIDALRDAMIAHGLIAASA